MTQRLQKYLIDAQSAANDISKFLEGVSRDEFINNKLLCRAIEREFEILGEALNLASKEKKDLESEILDLPKIIGLRNKIIHGYDSIDNLLLWNTAQVKVPLFSQCVIELLKQIGS